MKVFLSLTATYIGAGRTNRRASWAAQLAQDAGLKRHAS